jgi:hypothetical protein
VFQAIVTWDSVTTSTHSQTVVILNAWIYEQHLSGVFERRHVHLINDVDREASSSHEELLDGAFVQRVVPELGLMRCV